jgi:hypothetical protein
MNAIPVILAGLFLAIGATCAERKGTQRKPKESNQVAVSADIFLSSLGANTHVDQGCNPANYVEALRYLGIRNLRDGQRNLSGYLMLHRQTGILVDLVGADTSGLLMAARTLAKAGALLSVEGPNEPNNFPITYNGRQGGGNKSSWVPVAQLQRDLFNAVKSDPELRRYPVFHVSEGGAEVDNVGLQFLTIPIGAGALFPDGTRFADYANPHNYVSGHGGAYVDNQAWQAADPTLNDRWDGLYVEYGMTWRGRFKGYSDAELQTLPRVTSETGWDAASAAEERTQGIVLVNTYLSQFKRGWRYTFIYELGEGEGGGGHQGLFHADWTPKLSATYIHNLTSVLADTGALEQTGRLDYSIVNEPATVHDLLLEKHGGTFDLIVWGEQVSGSNELTVQFGRTRSRVTIFDTIVGTSPIRQLTNVSQVPLLVSDHAMILEIK